MGLGNKRNKSPVIKELLASRVLYPASNNFYSHHRSRIRKEQKGKHPSAIIVTFQGFPAELFLLEIKLQSAFNMETTSAEFSQNPGSLEG